MGKFTPNKMDRFHKALPNVKSAYVTLQNFTPDLKNFYTDISAVSATLWNSAEELPHSIWNGFSTPPPPPYGGFPFEQHFSYIGASLSHKIWWKIGQQFVNYIQWHISHQISWSPNLSPYFAPNLVFTHFGDKYITKFGDKFRDHQICHFIRWQSCHQIWWTPNLSPNNSPNLVTNVSSNWVLTEFVTKFITKFVTKFGDHQICHQIWWQIRHQICHQILREPTSLIVRQRRSAAEPSF